MKKNLFCLSILSSVLLFSQGQPISPFNMGQNYWYTDWHDPSQSPIQIFEATGHYSTSPTSTVSWPAITVSSVRLCRIGGEPYNLSSNNVGKPQSGQEIYYVSIIDDIRKNGSEPVLTLPFLLAVNNPTTPEPNYTDGADGERRGIFFCHRYHRLHRRDVSRPDAHSLAVDWLSLSARLLSVTE